MQKIGRLTPPNHVLSVVDDAGDRERWSSVVLDSAALAVSSSVLSAQFFSLFSLISLSSPIRPIFAFSSDAKVPFVRTGPGTEHFSQSSSDVQHTLAVQYDAVFSIVSTVDLGLRFLGDFSS